MTALATIIGVLCLLAAGELRRETWPDGRPRAEFEVELDSTGREQRAGKYRSWHENGALASEGSFADDREIGRWKFFHADGRLAAEGSFGRGERVGPWETFHPGGPRESKGRYEKGKRSGPWSFWTPAGELQTEDSGTYAFVERRAADGRIASGHLLDGAPHGEWKSTWPTGGPQLVGELVRGRRIGLWLFLDRAGNPVRLLSDSFERGEHRTPASPEAHAAGGAALSLPAPAHGALGSLPEAEALRSELGAWLAMDETQRSEKRQALAREERRPAWIECGPRCLPLVLERLLACDPEDDVARATIGRLDALVLRPLLGGHALGTLSTTAPLTAEAAREFQHAWANLWATTADDAWFWCVEQPSTPLDEAGALADAPFLRSPIANDGASAPPALFAQRHAERHGPNEAPLAAALAWLEATQRADGSWSPEPDARTPPSRLRAGNQVGVTALALLAQLGAGRRPEEASLARGLGWLLARQREDGRIWSAPQHDWLYGHAMATQALSEAFALAPSPVLRGRLQRAVDLLFSARNPYAAWRYDLPPTGENDTSITGWAVQALFTARAAGLEGPFQDAFDGASIWIEQATDPANGRVGYDAMGTFSARTEVNERFPREKGEPLTAAALLVRRLLGHPLDAPHMQKHRERLLERPPLWDPEGLGIDEYYVYYGAQALALCGELDPAWEAGLRQIARATSGNAAERGSWDPLGVWAAYGGRVYSTALFALALEAPFRYSLAAPEGEKPARKKR